MNSEAFYRAVYDESEDSMQNDVPVANALESVATEDECVQKGFDLNDYLVRNKPSTFFMRVRSDAMAGAGIYRGDVVIIDRAQKAVNGKVVIAVLHGEMLIRRFEKSFNKIRLLPETHQLSPIDIDVSCEGFSIWGVVTYAIHSL